MLDPKRAERLLWFKRRLGQIMDHPSALPLSTEAGAPYLERQRLLAGIVLGTGRWEKVLQDV